MNVEVMLTQIIKDLGALEQRLTSLETFVCNHIAQRNEISKPIDESYDCDYDPIFSYPMEASKVTEASTNHFRCIKNSMYKVYIAKPHISPEDPDSRTIMEVDMTRDELDEWIDNSPGASYGEYIYKVIPSMDEYI